MPLLNLDNVHHDLYKQCIISTKEHICTPITLDEPVVIGIDEVGRGALFAHLTVAAVILPTKLCGEFGLINLNGSGLELINDSKKLTAKRREQLFEPIKNLAVDYAIVDVPRSVIDKLNVLHATMLGMRLAAQTLIIRHQLSPQSTDILIDGHQLPVFDGDFSCFRQQSLIKGDGIHSSIACASILAKVHRDRQMLAFDAKYPEYQLGTHKGYLTKSHKDAIIKHGILPEHRRSYAPIAQLFAEQKVNHRYWLENFSA